MTISRIYQGRVSCLQAHVDGGMVPAELACDRSSKDLLWQHHVLFQDAVNYYLVALGALAEGESTNRVIRDLQQRLRDSWETFPRRIIGAEGLRDSLRRTLPELKANSTLEDAFKLILQGNNADLAIRVASLGLLLAICGGEAAIQQGGRGYLPRFCDTAYTGSWDCDATAAASGEGKDKLARVLHSDAAQPELVAIAAEMELSWTIKLQPDKFYTGEDARVRLREAIEHLLTQLDTPSPRLAEALKEHEVEAREFLAGALEKADSLPDELTISRNRKAAPDLTFASIAFMHFPHRVTQQFLKLGVKAPGKVAATIPSGKPGALAAFAIHGDDPVKLARGGRGYVFPAFTALPAWKPRSPGHPAWKEFDIAAFKEALKALNQFSQKTIERESKRGRAEQMKAYIIGESDERPRDPDSGEDMSLRRIPTDQWKLIRQLEKHLSENLNEGEWHLSRKSLRGFGDIVERWRTEVIKSPQASTETLWKIVTDYQKNEKNRREIGSVQLFQLLVEPEYRPLWSGGDGDGPGDEDAEETSAGASSPLHIATQVHRLEDEIERCHQPINLTPAEPRHSRRLFMFSDLTDKLAKVKFGDTQHLGERQPWLETAIAVKSGMDIHETRVRIDFSAPRLARDELIGGAESRWLQPMMAALGFQGPAATTAGFDSACALMPEVDEEGRVRHLLNFPVALDAEPLRAALGKAARWRYQFNGTKDNALHLHWPGTWKNSGKNDRTPWWENPHSLKHGFTVLANDLGQRSAGAWALLRVTPWRPENTKRPVRSIGHDGTREWFAEVLKTGLHRLPGEDQQVFVKGKRQVELAGKAGRAARKDEYDYARILAIKLGIKDDALTLDNWLGVHGDKSFPELNDTLLTIANRRLTRLGTYHRWSCAKPDNFKNEPTRHAKIIEGLETELASCEDPEVVAWLELVKARDFAAFRERTGKAFEKLRSNLEPHLVDLADLCAPLRQKQWRWVERRDGTPYGDLLIDKCPGETPRIRGQRGLSMSRLEQLESLRQVFLRYNRSLDRKPHEPAKFGREDQGRESDEPCQTLLDKIDRMKEQRVNQTAHLIIAQALGLQLKAKPESVSDEDKVNRRVRDLHGEYEKIPGREPVDFIIIEDLSRYLSSQGRAPSENSRLMKWAHRAVRDKLKMLAEEPFGLPVVEVSPAYSSRFHAVSGQPGSRVLELSALTAYQRARLEMLHDHKDKKESLRRAAANLLAQFDLVEPENLRRREANRALSGKDKDQRQPLLTLLLPKAGGPLFLGAREGNPVQADINAAINLGLRAVAAPGCLDVHRRVRAVKEGKKDQFRFSPRLDNAREKAAFAKTDRIVLSQEPSRKLAASNTPNFFYEPDGIGSFDVAELKTHRLVSSVSLWSMVNDAAYPRCSDVNTSRLAAWREWSILPAGALDTSSSQNNHCDDSNDQIPM